MREIRIAAIHSTGHNMHDSTCMPTHPYSRGIRSPSSRGILHASLVAGTRWGLGLARCVGLLFLVPESEISDLIHLPPTRTTQAVRDKMVSITSWMRFLGALCCCLLAYAWVPQGPLQQGKRAVGSSFRRASQQPWGASYVSSILLSSSRPPLRTLSIQPLTGAAESGADATTGGVTYDVAIIGGGPAGSVMAALLAQQHKLKVVMMDPKLDERWIPNYGVWLEEWQGMYVRKGNGGG